ncbi:MAG: glycosyltransferase family 39 protein [Anaerolineales bacterium]|nr:glycosyltransferase family 39 protein [Anaerolineales bacterium]
MNLRQLHSREKLLLFFAGILILGAGLRLIGLDKGIWLDEYSSIKCLSYNELTGEEIAGYSVLGRLMQEYQLSSCIEEFIIQSVSFYQDLRLYDHPPLYFVLLKVWSGISSEESFLRLLSVLFGLGTLTFVMLWIKRVSPPAALVTGLLCAVSPILLRYSQEIRNYPLLLLATAVSFYYASRLAADPKSWSNTFGLTIGLTVAVSTHLVGAMLVTSVFCYIFLSLPDPKKILSSRFMCALVTPFIVFIFFNFHFLKLLDKSTWWIPSPTPELMVETASILSGWRVHYWLAYVLQTDLIPYTAWLVLTKSAVAICLGCLLLFGDWRKSFRPLVAAIFFWLQLLGYSWIAAPVFWYRTALPGMVPFLGFVGLQVSTIHRVNIRRLVITGLALASLLFAAYWTLNQAGKPFESVRELAQILNQQREPGDIILFFPQYTEGPVRYYAPDITPENAIQVHIGMNVQTLDLPDIETASAVYLVVRDPGANEQELVTYQQLLVYLQAEFGSPTRVFDGRWSIDKYDR